MLIESQSRTDVESELTTSRVDVVPAAPTRIRYRVLAFACGLSMITYLDRVCFGAAAPDLAKELALENGVADLKWAFTAFSIAYAIFEIPSGWLGDRWGPRGVLIRIVSWWSICTVLTGLVGLQVGAITLGGIWTLVALRFLFGAGEAGAYPNITRTLHNWFPSQQWETAQGAIWMTGRLMGGLTPLVWALLVSGTAYTPRVFDSWRGAFFLFGVIGIAWCVAFAIWFRNRPAEHPAVNESERDLIGTREHAGDSHAGVPWLALLRSRSLMALCLMYSLVTFVWIFNITYLPSYLKERFAVADGDIFGAIYKGAPLWVGAIGCLAGGALVSFIARRLGGDRRHARRILGVTAMSTCAALWISVFFARDIHTFCILVAASALCIDLTIGSIWATCQDLGQRYAAVTAACMNMIGTFGAAVAGWLTGTLIETSIASRAAALDVAVTAISPIEKHAAVMHGYNLVFTINVAAFVVAAFCWLLIDPTKRIEAERHPELI